MFFISVFIFITKTGLKGQEQHLIQLCLGSRAASRACILEEKHLFCMVNIINHRNDVKMFKNCAVKPCTLLSLEHFDVIAVVYKSVAHAGTAVYKSTCYAD